MLLKNFRVSDEFGGGTKYKQEIKSVTVVILAKDWVLRKRGIQANGTSSGVDHLCGISSNPLGKS